jgi:hypothetical protein
VSRRDDAAERTGNNPFARAPLGWMKGLRALTGGASKEHQCCFEIHGDLTSGLAARFHSTNPRSMSWHCSSAHPTASFPKIESSADAQVPIAEDLRLDAPFPVIPEFSGPGDVILVERPERIACGT